MPELINIDKGLDSPAFNTFIPELEEPADIRDALKLLYYGTLEDGPTYETTNSLYGNLIDFDTRIDQNNSLFIGHDGAISDVHGVGAGSQVVGTIKAQTLTNKTLTSPTITGGTLNGGAALTVNSTELNYVDNVTSPIQTQINTNTPVGMISIHAGTTAPTGWLLCKGQAVSRATYASLFGVVSTNYGSGDGSTTFNLPDLQGRVVVGVSDTQGEFNLRDVGGNMNHQHIASNSASASTAHNHTVSATNGTALATGSHNHSVNSNHTHPIPHNHTDNIVATIGGGSHNHGLSGVVNPNTTAVGRASSGNTSTNFQLGGFQATDNFAVSNSPSHAHTATMSGNVTGTPNSTDSGGSNTANFNTVSGNTANTGGDHAHNVSNNAATINDSAGGSHAHTVPASSSLSNLQPYITLNYIIKF
jgi:microcystin-dependent protein